MGRVAADSSTIGSGLKPCSVGRSKTPARCGVFRVRENRSFGSGRTIALRIVLLLARHSSGRAVAFIAGGPGQSAVALAPAIADGAFARELDALRDRFDILLVDNRGMGGSNAFGCDFTPATDPGSYFAELWPDKYVSACRARIGQTGDPNFYNTNNAVADLDEVRAALGYRKLVLDGSSYGTLFAFVFLRRNPEHVESAVLDGVYAPHFQPVPGAPAAAQIALNDLASRCVRDITCRSHFPSFLEHFRAIVARFDRGPISMTLRRKGATPRRVLLSKEVFVDDIRQMLDEPGNAAYLPATIEAAWSGNYDPLAQLIEAVAQGLSHGLDWAAFLSYTCADEIPFVSETRVRREAARSFAKDLRVRAQQRACSRWNIHAMPQSFNEPVWSDTPVLMIGGSDDPATPPRYSTAELPYLPKARQVIIAGAGHATETACTDRLKVDFIRDSGRSTATRLGCSEKYVPPRFSSTP